MWGKNKNKGIYDNYTEIDKLSKKQKNFKSDNALADHEGFYMRDIHNRTSNKQPDSIGFDDLKKPDNIIMSENATRVFKNKNNTNNFYNQKNEHGKKENNINIEDKWIHELRNKIEILNYNINVINKNLNLLKIKIVNEKNQTYENLKKDFLTIKEKQAELLNDTKKFNWPEKKQNEIDEKTNNYLSNENNIKLQKENLHNIVNNARQKNNDLKKINNYDDNKFISVKERVASRDNYTNKNHPYYELRQKLLKTQNNLTLSKFLQEKIDEKN